MILTTALRPSSGIMQYCLSYFFLLFSHSDVTGWTIQLGVTRRHSHSYYGQKMKVRRVVPHPMYNIGVPHDNDVALFQVSTIIVINLKLPEHFLLTIL